MHRSEKKCRSLLRLINIVQIFLSIKPGIVYSHHYVIHFLVYIQNNSVLPRFLGLFLLYWNHWRFIEIILFLWVLPLFLPLNGISSFHSLILSKLIWISIKEPLIQSNLYGRGHQKAENPRVCSSCMVRVRLIFICLFTYYIRFTSSLRLFAHFTKYCCVSFLLLSSVS